MEIYIKLGEIIRKRRLEKKMTMKELGEKTGFSDVGILHYEKGERKMSFDTFLDICKVLELDPLKVTESIYNKKEND